MVSFKEKIKILVCSPLMYTHFIYLPAIFGILRNAVKDKDLFWYFPLYNSDTFDDDIGKINPMHIDVLCLSIYVWNRDKLLNVAKSIKHQNPRCKIVVGGPEVTEEFNKYVFIDNIVIGEAENVFADILDGNNDRIIFSKQVTDFNDSYWLDNQDYYSLMIDRIRSKGKKPVVSFETDRGCPYECSFCNWSQSKIRLFPMDRVKKEIEWFCKKGIYFIEFANSNFGMLNRDYEISKKIIEEKEKTTYPDYVVYSSAKLNLDNVIRITKLFSNYNLLYHNGVAIQSTNAKVLDAVNRKNFKLSELKLISDISNIAPTPQLILGLPGDNFERFSQTFEDLMNHGFMENFQVFPFQLLSNSPAYSKKYRDKWEIETIYRHNQRSRRKLDNKNRYSSLAEYVVKTKTFDKEDYLKMWYYSTIVSAFSRIVTPQKPYKDFYHELYEIFDFKNIKDNQRRFIYEDGYLEFEHPISKLTNQMYDSEEYMLIEILLNWNIYKEHLKKYSNRLDRVIHIGYRGNKTHTGPNDEYPLDFKDFKGNDRIIKYVNSVIGTLYKRNGRILE